MERIIITMIIIIRSSIKKTTESIAVCAETVNAPKRRMQNLLSDTVADRTQAVNARESLSMIICIGDCDLTRPLALPVNMATVIACECGKGRGQGPFTQCLAFWPLFFAVNVANCDGYMRVKPVGG